MFGGKCKKICYIEQDKNDEQSVRRKQALATNKTVQFLAQIDLTRNIMIILRECQDSIWSSCDRFSCFYWRHAELAWNDMQSDIFPVLEETPFLR